MSYGALSRAGWPVRELIRRIMADYFKYDRLVGVQFKTNVKEA
ncbi:hypothetical protein [Heyndrickxia coagulans]|uniref:Uncharacterized protein n=1 Tax=Heyndrickxia coagulans TaxID=1398 RepID=A0AAW7C6Q4_HEYCO|nr:hypothetical protein [Heyndrickxia coagulans]MDL5039507.1 hypothetical protein [Heyndrickxia coagulans]